MKTKVMSIVSALAMLVSMTAMPTSAENTLNWEDYEALTEAFNESNNAALKLVRSTDDVNDEPIMQMSENEFLVYLDECNDLVEAENALYDIKQEVNGETVYSKSSDWKKIADAMGDDWKSYAVERGYSVEAIEAHWENEPVEAMTVAAETVSPRTTTALTEQRCYYNGSTQNYMYTKFYWVSVDGSNRYSSMYTHSSHQATYPAYRFKSIDSARTYFHDNYRQAMCTYNVYYCPSSNISQDAGYTIAANYTAGGGNIYK